MNFKLHLSLIAAFILQSLFVSAQQENPVSFSYSAVKKNANTYEVHIKAAIQNGWHIYAQAQPKEAISSPTKFSFTKNPLLSITGDPKEIGRKETYEDKSAGIVQYHYEKEVEFVQVITVKAKVKTNLSGNVSYQACTDERCLPEKTVSFSIPLN